jgi:peroxiredoxin
VSVRYYPSTMIAFLLLFVLTVPGVASGVDLQSGDLFPSFDLKEAVVDLDYKYLGLSKGSFFSKGKISLNDITGELLFVEFLNRYCMVCQKDAPEFNKLFDMMENDPNLKGKAKILAIAVGNSTNEVKNFRKEFNVRFPVVADRETDVYRLAGSPPGSPLLYVLRKKTNKWVIVDGIKGEVTYAELLGRAKACLSLSLNELQKKDLWSRSPLKRLSENEMLKMLRKRMGTLTVSKKIPFEHGDLYVVKKGKEVLFAKEESRGAICVDCHDAFFVYVFDRKGIVRDFIPIYLTKEYNEPFTDQDVNRIRRNLVGRNMLTPFKFDKEVDAVTSATLTSFLIYDSVHHGKELLNVIKREGVK